MVGGDASAPHRVEEYGSVYHLDEVAQLFGCVVPPLYPNPQAPSGARCCAGCPRLAGCIRGRRKPWTACGSCRGTSHSLRPCCPATTSIGISRYAGPGTPEVAWRKAMETYSGMRSTRLTCSENFVTGFQEGCAVEVLQAAAQVVGYAGLCPPMRDHRAWGLECVGDACNGVGYAGAPPVTMATPGLPVTFAQPSAGVRGDLLVAEVYDLDALIHAAPHRGCRCAPPFSVNTYSTPSFFNALANSRPPSISAISSPYLWCFCRRCLLRHQPFFVAVMFIR